MNLVSISCGGLADWGFGELQDRNVPLFGIFSVFASIAIVSIVLVLLIRPKYIVGRIIVDDHRRAVVLNGSGVPYG